MLPPVALVDVQMAGVADAVPIRADTPLPSGPGAEGRPGDWLLVNARARFVVGGEDRADPSPLYAGALLDAALHGQEDYVRVLAPHVGTGPAPSVVCEEVRALGPDTQHGAATVMAMGHWARDDAVIVRTLYRLEPDSPAIEIITSLENLGPRTLREVDLCDVVYHGRTERFVEGVGWHPSGRSGQANCFCFFADRLAWGLFAAAAMPMHTTNRDGWSRLTYCQHTVPPGEVRTYRRRLLAAVGGPEQIGREVLALTRPPTGEVRVHVEERGTGAPVAGASVVFESPPGRPATIAFSDQRGDLQAAVRAGSCRVTCRAQGRDPFQCRFAVRRGSQSALTVRMCRPARLRVRVREAAGRRSTPTSARLTLAQAAAGAPPLPEAPFYSRFEPGTILLVPRSGELEVPLPPAPGQETGTYIAVASKGPLYDTAAALATVEAGRTATVELTLRRVIDPGDYVAVDFGQRMGASPDSALTPAERALLNDCEGLDGAVVVGRAVAAASAPAARPEGPPVLAALEGSTPHTGRFTLIMLPEDAAMVTEPLPPRGEWGEDAEQVFGTMRRYFPRSLIQVDAPMHEHTGYFRLTGFRPGAVPRLPFCERFDALRVLAGSARGEAAEVLQCWFELLGRGRRIFVTGGSDSASVRDARMMAGRTYVYCPAWDVRPSRVELVAAVRALAERPNAFVTNGPFLKLAVEGLPPGSVVTAREGAVRMHLRVEAAPWVDVQRVKVLRNGVPVEVLKVGEAVRRIRLLVRGPRRGRRRHGAALLRRARDRGLSVRRVQSLLGGRGRGRGGDADALSRAAFAIPPVVRRIATRTRSRAEGAPIA